MRIRRLTTAALLATTLSAGVATDIAAAQTATTEADEGLIEEGREQVDQTVSGEDNNDDSGKWGLLGLLGLLGLGGLAGLRRRNDRTERTTVGSERIAAR